MAIRSFQAGLAISLVFYSVLNATLYDWVSFPVDGNLQNAANWTPGGGPPGAADTTQFDGTDVTSVFLNNGATMTILDLGFSTTLTYTPAIQGNLTLSGAGVNNISFSSTASQAFTIANTSGTTAAQLNFTNSATADNSIVGSGVHPFAFYNINAGVGSQGSTMVFQNTSTAGGSSITCQGSSGGVPATLSFLNSSSLGIAAISVGSDGTNIGMLNVQNNADLNNSVITLTGGSHVINSATPSTGNATVVLNTSSAPASNANLSLQQTNNFGSFTSQSGCTLTFDTTTSTLTIGASNDSKTINGTFLKGTGDGSLTKAGTGTYTLANTGNTFTQGVSITGGTLVIPGEGSLGTGGAVTLASGTTLEVTAGFTSSRNFTCNGGRFQQSTSGLTHIISGTLAGTNITQLGSGTLSLTNASNTYTGTTSLSAGTLIIAADGSLGTGTGATGAVTMASNTTLNLSSASSTSSSRNFTCNNGTFVQSSGITHTITPALAGTNITQSGPGTLSLSATATYTGTTNISGGTLALSGGLLPSGTAVTATGILDLTNASGNAQTIGSLSGAGTVTLGTTALTTGGSNATTTFSGTINGTGSLTKAGTGNFTLSNPSNGYTGGTTIGGASGTFFINDDGSLGPSGTVTFTVSGPILNVQNTATSARNFSLGPAGNFAQGSSSVVHTISGVVSGTNLNQRGPGTLSLTNNSNSITNTLEIIGGTLSCSGTSLNSVGFIAMFANSTLNASANATVTAPTLEVLSGAGNFSQASSSVTLSVGSIIGTGTSSVVQNGPGTLSITAGGSSYNGGTQVLGGTLSINDDSSLGGGGVTIQNASTLNAANSTTSSRAFTLGTGGGIFTQSSSGITHEIDGLVSGSSLSQNGPGTLFLTDASNSYTGGTTIGSATTVGTLSIQSDAVLGTAGVTINNGSTLNAAATTSSSRTFTLGTGGGIFTQNPSVNHTISGLISGTSLTENGTGTLTLTNTSPTTPNNYSGGTTIEGGTLSIPADSVLGSGNMTMQTGGILNTTASFSTSRTFTLGSGGGVFSQTASTTYTIDGQITSTGSLTQNGPGVLNPTNATNNYGGGTTIGGGTLSIASDSVLGTGNMTMATGGILNTTASFSTTRTFSLGTGGGVFSQTASTAYTVNGVISGSSLTQNGPGTLTLDAANSYSGGTTVSAGTLNFTGTGNLQSGSNLNANGGTTDFSTYNGSPTLGDLNGNSGAIIKLGSNTLTATTANPDSYAGIIQGTGGFTKAGASTLSFGGNNTYTGTTLISNGTLSLSGTGNISSGIAPSGVNVNSATSIFDISTSSVNQTIGDLSGVGSSSVTLGANTLTVTPTTNDLFSGVISGTGGVTLNANHTLSLAGSNTYTGTTLITTGKVSLSGTGNISSGATPSGVNVNSGTSIFDISASSGNQTIGDLNGVTSSSVTLGANTLTVTPTTNDLFSGVISGTGGVTLNANHTLSLAGSNTYTGTTLITTGKLSLSGTGNISSGITPSSVNVNSATAIFDISTSTVNQNIGDLNGVGSSSVTLGANTLTITPTAPDTFSGVISGTGGITKQGATQLTLDGNNTYTGTTTLTAGTLTLGGSNASTTTTVTTGTLNFTASGSLLTGDNLNADGGTTDFSTYSGSPSLGDLTGTGSGAIINLGAKNLAVTTASTDTYAGIIQGSGSFNKQGASQLTLKGNNTFTGTTTVTAGTLTLGGSNASTTTTVTAGTLNFTATGSLLTGSNLNANGGTTDFSTYNGSPTLGDLNGSGSSAVINLGSNTLAVTTTAADVYAGSIQGSGGNFNKLGAAQLTLFGNNTYTGTTTLTAGTLTLGGSNASTTTTVTAGTLNFTSMGSLLTGGNLNANGGTTDFSTYNSSPNLGDLKGTGVGAVINLGAKTLTVTTANPDTYAGIIQGTGSFTKQGSTALTLEGANTFSGGTTVNAGILNFTVSGNLLSGSNLNANGGTTDFSVYNGSPTFGDLNGSGGSAIIKLGSNNLAVTTTAADSYAGIIQGTGSFTKQGSTALTLGGANTYSGGTTVTAGTLNFTASGNLLSGSNLSANGGTTDFSTYNGSPTLGDVSGAGNIVLGSNTITLSTGTYSGVMSGIGGSLIKQGAGTFTMQGANTYDTDTTINNGTLTLSGSGSLVSPVNVNSASSVLNTAISTSIGDLSGSTATSSVTLGGNTLSINTTTASTFAGAISGTGGAINLLGSGSLNLTGASNYTGGTTVGGTSTLFVNGTVGSAGSTVTVNSGATLGGTGTITGDVTIASGGLMSPGNSIGTINITGNYTQGTGSTLIIELNPTQSDKLIVTGTVDIQSNTTIEIIPTPGDYPSTSSFVLIHANGGLIGQHFSTVIDTFPTFKATLDYTSNEVLLVAFQNVLLGNLGFTGNAEAVANALDEINPAPGTDLGNIEAALRFLPLNQLEAALDQMQPSIFKGLALSQENAIIRVKDPFMYRMHEYFWVDCIRDCCGCEQPDIWAIAIGDYAEQKSIQRQNGFRDMTAGMTAGIDFGCYNGAFFGTGLGYTYTNIHWSGKQAKGNINSGYAGIYGGYFNDAFYIDALALASYNHYEASRKLVSPVFDRVAHNQHNGFTLDGSAEMGFFITKWTVQLMPFDRFDYIYLWEDSFNEHGAGGLDLHISHAKSTMFRNEVGLRFTKCLISTCFKLVPELKASWIYERRFQGRHYTAEFIGTTVPFVVSGMKPIRSLWSLGFAVAGYHQDDNFLWSFYWDSEYGEHFMDQNVGLEISYRF